MSNKNTSNNGMDFFGWLTLIFIVLKLTGVISWTWWWVLSPLWIPLSMVIIIFAFVGLFALVKSIKSSYKQ